MNWEDTKEFIKIFGEFTVCAIIVLAIIFGTLSIPFYYGSCRSAEIYNKTNNTDYTCSDFFWASKQINSNSQTLKIK